MVLAKYSVGVDFGTLSGRAVLVNVETGEECASAVLDYPHAVMDRTLPDGTPLGLDWALQHPADYLEVLRTTVPKVLQLAEVSPSDVIGIGIDMTSSTAMPVYRDGTPLCFTEEYQSDPHAYVKLWKHHSPQKLADRMNEVANERGESFLKRYGGKISSEWYFPKLWEILMEDEPLYRQMDYYIEAVDWVIWQLCGQYTRSSCCAGYKAFWSKREGYPSKAFFRALDPRLEQVVEEKIACPVSSIGQKAGELTESGAALCGLLPGTAVAIANVDAHVCVPAVGITGANQMLAIMGTSTCHVLLSKEERVMPGIGGIVEDGVLPGFFGYEAGQSCVGDQFAWFVDNCLPASYVEDAKQKHQNLHEYLREKAQRLKPGESGLLALDWWNGNRSCLVDFDLTGMLLGMTLQTKPEEIYRALIESTAFGTRKIIDMFEENGVPVDEFIASGGIAQKDPMTMQIYADVIRRPIRIAASKQGPALGSAIFGAVAAGAARGGYDDPIAAAKAMGKVLDLVYEPNEEHAAIYDRLYAEYSILHDYFGRGENDVMKRLKAIKAEVQ